MKSNIIWSLYSGGSHSAQGHRTPAYHNYADDDHNHADACARETVIRLRAVEKAR